MGKKSKKKTNTLPPPKTPRSVGKSHVPATPKSTRPANLRRLTRRQARVIDNQPTQPNPSSPTPMPTPISTPVSSPPPPPNPPTPHSQPAPAVPVTPLARPTQNTSPAESVPSTPLARSSPTELLPNPNITATPTIAPITQSDPQIETASSEVGADLPIDPLAILPDASEAPTLANPGNFPAECPLCTKSIKTHWLMLRHLISCFMRYRKQFKNKVTFRSIYNLFNPFLKKKC